MVKQLKDFITISDILNENDACITTKFPILDSSYNSYLIDMLNNNVVEISLEYLGNRLDKMLSPLYSRLIDYYLNEGYDKYDSIDNANVDLMKVITSKFLYNWNRLAEAMFKDYNPINNYDMTEQREIIENKGQNVTTNAQQNITQSGNESIENQVEENSEDSTSTETSTQSDLTSKDNEQQNYAGFNSLEPKVVTTSSKDGNSTEINKGSSEEMRSSDKSSSSKEDKTNSSTESSTSSSNVESLDSSEDNSRQEELRRSGNIGVTTSQQMIQSEIELRKHNLKDIIYANMDEILFLDYYC